MWWRIYYADGTKFTDGEGTPYDAPAIGVVVITQADATNRFRTVTGDFYVCWPWGWEACDIFGLWDYLASAGPKTVKFGRTLSNEVYDRVYQTALREAYNDFA